MALRDKIPEDVNSRSTSYGTMTPAQLRTLAFVTRNTESRLRFGIGLMTDNLRNGESRRVIEATFESGVSITIGEDGRLVT